MTSMRVKINTLGIPYKDIADYYECDKYGIIYGYGGKPLKPTYCGDRKYGYQGITLSLKGGGKIHKGVNRIIALAFVDGRTDERNEVDHINNNPADNMASNLQWVSHKENMRKMWKHRKGGIL